MGARAVNVILLGKPSFLNLKSGKLFDELGRQGVSYAHGDPCRKAKRSSRGAAVSQEIGESTISTFLDRANGNNSASEMWSSYPSTETI